MSAFRPGKRLRMSLALSHLSWLGVGTCVITLLIHTEDGEQRSSDILFVLVGYKHEYTHIFFSQLSDVAVHRNYREMEISISFLFIIQSIVYPPRISLWVWVVK